MDNSFLIYNRELSEEMQKLLYWFKWKRKETVIENKSVDIREIFILLQIMGFDLKSLEKPEDVEDITEQCTLEINLRCNRSGMRAVLTKQITSCVCPSNNTAFDIDSILLPRNITIIKGLLSRALSIVCEANINNDNNESSDSTSFNYHRSVNTMEMEDSENDVTATKRIKNQISLHDCDDSNITADNGKKMEISDERVVEDFQDTTTPSLPRRNTQSVSNPFRVLNNSKVHKTSLTEEPTSSEKERIDGNSNKTVILEKTMLPSKRSDFSKYILKTARKCILQKYLKRKRKGLGTSKTSLRRIASSKIYQGVKPGTSGLQAYKHNNETRNTSTMLENKEETSDTSDN